MASPTDPAPRRLALPRLHEAAAAVRQANHVLAAAVLVFAAGLLVTALLSRYTVPFAVWITERSGPRTWLVVAPLLHDLPRAVCLLLVAFPLGRVTAPRPVPTAVGLVALVYAFDYGIAYAFGNHALLYHMWRAWLGRGVLLLLVVWGVIALIARGRAAALRADRAGSVGLASAAAPAAAEASVAGPSAADPSAAGSGEAPHPVATEPCKEPARPDVPRVER